MSSTKKKRMQMEFDFQRYHAKMNYRPRIGGGATTLDNLVAGTAEPGRVAW